MKKQIVTACALIVSIAAFAASVESANTFGVMKITASAGSQVIIPVPWVSIGSNNCVKATEYILPNGRVAYTEEKQSGEYDALYWYNPETQIYSEYQVRDGAWVGQETEYESQNITPPVSFERGTAALLQLASGVSAEPIYLSGEYTTGTAVVEVYGHDAEFLAEHANASKSTLVAPPTAADYYPNDSQTWAYGTTEELDGTGDIVKDQLAVAYPSGAVTNFTYYSADKFGSGYPAKAGWYRINGDELEAAVIPAGCGAWYIRYNQGNLFIRW